MSAARFMLTGPLVTKLVAANTAPASASTAASKDFTVDRPFLFYIKIKKNVVLVGRVADPTL
jgi:serine protease inhibitor